MTCPETNAEESEEFYCRVGHVGRILLNLSGLSWLKNLSSRMKQFVLFLAMEVGRARDQRGKPTALLGFYINAEGWSRVWAKTGNALRPCTHDSWQRLIHNFGCAARANTPWVSPIAANSGVLSQEGWTKRSTLHNLSIQSWLKMKKCENWVPLHR